MGVPKLHRACQISDKGPCDPCLRLQDLESQLYGAQRLVIEAKRAVDDLLERHRQLRTEVNLSHNPIILQLPPEIASYIFHFTTHHGTLDLLLDDGALHKSFAAPLVLGAVCRGWRQIAWSSPDLWSSLLVRFKASHVALDLEILKEWLSRSRTLPLTICAFMVRTYTPADDDLSHFEGVIDVINQCSSRWRVLDLRIPTSFYRFFKGDARSGSLLDSLSLRPASWHNQYKFSLRTQSPAPRTIILYQVPFNSVDINWSNITRAEIGNFNLVECLMFFQQVPRLESCTLLRVVSSMQQEFQVPSNILTLSHLREFTFDFREPISRLIFERVSFPVLEKFQDIRRSAWAPFSHTTLASLIRRSSCHLKQLCLSFVTVDEDFLKFLKGMPSLVTLELGVFMHNRELFTLITNSSMRTDPNEPFLADDIEFLPNLQKFTYYTANSVPWDFIPRLFGPLSQLNNSRRRPLNEIVICFRGPFVGYVDERYLPSYTAVLEAGLSLKVEYGGDGQRREDLIRATQS